MHPRLKADLHVHSKHSSRPSQWVLQKIGCPESFTSPQKIYDCAMKRGMDLVTITDHNAISGCLEIAHLPHTFISEEITTYFPEDQCKLHVLAYDINEEDHREFQRLRQNVFDLTAYLRSRYIVHSLAHPLFSINERLTVKHVEQCLILFNLFELNGCRDQSQNDTLQAIIGCLTKERFYNLVQKHALPPWGEEPWKKGMTAGSDDHSSLNIASFYTVADQASTREEFFQRIAAKEGRGLGMPATPEAMARNLYSIAYQFYHDRFRLRNTRKSQVLRFVHAGLSPEDCPRTSLMEKMHRFFATPSTRLAGVLFDSGTMQDHLLREAREIILADSNFVALSEGYSCSQDELDRIWFSFVTRASNRMIAHFLQRFFQSLHRANLFDIFHSIGAAGSFYTLMAPYFLAYGLFSRERVFARDCLNRLGAQQSKKKLPSRCSVAHFTDTYEDINGVAWTIRRQMTAATRHCKPLHVLTCGSPGQNDLPRVHLFPAVGTFAVPEYPEQTVNCPPFLDVLNHCFGQNYTLLLAATPGPMGLAALAVSRILKIPCHGTYHSAFPEYVLSLTRDTAMEDACRRYMHWFYNQLERVYAPSRATAHELQALGVDPRKIHIYPRGVDTEIFHPAKKNGFYAGSVPRKSRKVLYVGRVSREKNLHLLAQAFSRATKKFPDIHLVIVGDGPFLEEMRAQTAGLPVLFTGMLHKEELVQAYASADLFVFPSATDTFGNVVLEAQASGLPVIVTDKGGPVENMLPDETGLVCRANDPEDLCRCLQDLLGSPLRMKRMGQKGREYMASRDFDRAFLDMWQLFASSTAPRNPCRQTERD